MRALSLLAPFVLEAQPATKVWRIGYLGPVSSSGGSRLLESDENHEFSLHRCDVVVLDSTEATSEVWLFS
jgi:hypothetical protein